MPDSHGNFKGMSVPAAAWERIFGKPAESPCPCHGDTYQGLRPCTFDKPCTYGRGHEADRWAKANNDNRPADR